jgi:hypothetical protein
VDRCSLRCIQENPENLPASASQSRGITRVNVQILLERLWHFLMLSSTKWQNASILVIESCSEWWITGSLVSREQEKSNDRWGSLYCGKSNQALNSGFLNVVLNEVSEKKDNDNVLLCPTTWRVALLMIRQTIYNLCYFPYQSVVMSFFFSPMNQQMWQS